MRIVRFVVSGRVQGVGFRYFVGGLATRHGLVGWVRNRRDGAVEGVAGGAPEAVEALLAACRRGPPSAYVGAVDVTEADESALAARVAGEQFSVLRSW